VQVAFDDQEKVAYLIGGTKLYIIDLSPEALLVAGSPATEPKPLSAIANITLPTTINDVAFCGGYLAVAANGATKVLPGSVTLYSRYLRKPGSDASLEELAKFTVGKWDFSDQWIMAVVGITAIHGDNSWGESFVASVDSNNPTN
jgi:hypothetical protein